VTSWKPVGFSRRTLLHGVSKYFTEVQFLVKCELFPLSLSTPWRHKGESRGMAPLIFNLSGRWRWAVSFVPRRLYSWGKKPRYMGDSRLCTPLSQSEHVGREESVLLQIIQPVMRSFYRLSYPKSCSLQFCNFVLFMYFLDQKFLTRLLLLRYNKNRMKKDRNAVKLCLSRWVSCLDSCMLA